MRRTAKPKAPAGKSGINANGGDSAAGSALSKTVHEACVSLNEALLSNAENEPGTSLLVAKILEEVKVRE